MDNNFMQKDGWQWVRYADVEDLLLDVCEHNNCKFSMARDRLGNLDVLRPKTVEVSKFGNTTVTGEVFRKDVDEVRVTYDLLRGHYTTITRGAPVRAKDGYSAAKCTVDEISPKWCAVKRVIFNPPATIVFWEDGTKTVVKTDNIDGYDPYHGFCVAAAKKIFGNNSRIHKILKDKSNIEDILKIKESMERSWMEVMNERAVQLCEKLKSLMDGCCEHGKYPCDTCKNLNTDIDAEPCRSCMHGTNNSDAKSPCNWEGISEEKMCETCEHSDNSGADSPCLDCYVNDCKWEPKKEDNTNDQNS